MHGGAWRADAPIDRLAVMLKSAADFGELADYQGIAFVAHSMGGLVVQRALVVSPELAQKTEGGARVELREGVIREN